MKLELKKRKKELIIHHPCILHLNQPIQTILLWLWWNNARNLSQEKWLFFELGWKINWICSLPQTLIIWTIKNKYQPPTFTFLMVSSEGFIGEEIAVLEAKLTKMFCTRYGWFSSYKAIEYILCCALNYESYQKKKKINDCKLTNHSNCYFSDGKKWGICCRRNGRAEEIVKLATSINGPNFNSVLFSIICHTNCLLCNNIGQTETEVSRNCSIPMR